jgi:hypothetical protein
MPFSFWANQLDSSISIRPLSGSSMRPDLGSLFPDPNFLLPDYGPIHPDPCSLHPDLSNLFPDPAW